MAKMNSATERDLEKPSTLPHADRVNVSPQIAEVRADLGKDISLGQAQAFDGECHELFRPCLTAEHHDGSGTWYHLLFKQCRCRQALHCWSPELHWYGCCAHQISLCSLQL